MQLKKSPRDVRYPDSVTRYENESFGVEPSDDYRELPPEGLQQRPNRGVGAGPQEGDDRPTVEARSESVIDSHSSFDGRYETDHDLRVEGTVSGELFCRGLFTVEREASARARIQARDAHIKGRFEGDIVCSGKLLLASSAVVTGTLKATLLVVEEGCSLSGTVDTTQKASPVVESSRSGAATAAPKTASEPAPARESVATATGPRNGRREVPSFAIVSSEERASGERH